MSAAPQGPGARDDPAPQGPTAGAGYAQRNTTRELPLLHELLRGLRSRLHPSRPEPLPPRVQRHLAAARSQADALRKRHWRPALRATARALRAAGPTDPLPQRALLRALALAAHAMQRHNGLRAYDTQLQAAWLMLQGHLAEMATGEGKTLSTALAAGVAGLAGGPVHVITANDYLVERDADAMAPYFARLGLRCTHVTGRIPAAERAARWRHDVVYTTARELAFDYLRDHVALDGDRDGRRLRALAIESGGAAPAAPLLPGLGFALIDEADSVLLDEAVVPLILAQSAPADPADGLAWERAWRAAAGLRRQRDYLVHPAQRRAQLTPAGRARVEQWVQALGPRAGRVAPARRGAELVEAALSARWLYRRDHDYLVHDGQVQLIDALTGRVADGRQWQGALQPMVEIKEGLAPSAPTTTAAQITYQRFFPRYLRIGGMSGTLREARHELAVAYGTPVALVPLARPDRRRWLGEQVCTDSRWKWHAVLQAVQAQAALRRPVLVGTDSVADSVHLSELLNRAGVRHQVLNARQDADEAAAIARAGVAGMVTVATNIAGRGTDIRPDAAALEAGGLHVIAAMRNRSRRIDRQLTGRAARHGDPGSAEAIVALDDALPAALLPPPLHRLAGWLAALWPHGRRRRKGRLPGWLGRLCLAMAQRRAERQDAARRARLRRADRDAAVRHGFGGTLE